MTFFRILTIASALALSTAVAMAAPRPCSYPEALGTSREIAVGDAVKVGLKTYPQTLALADHEVVLTFDDGPSAKTTPRILDALEQECVTADFFLIGRNAAAAPRLVRREIEDGDTVGHHSFSHPAVTLRGLPPAAALADIEEGFRADDMAAYGSFAGQPKVPFFRFPGFADTPELLGELAREKIAVFGADLWASDWVPMTPEAELRLLMGRLDSAGRGIILLHDTKAQTALMMPSLLKALKSGGYRIVHAVPGDGPTPTAPAPPGWSSETARTIERLWTKIRHASTNVTAPRPAEP